MSAQTRLYQGMLRLFRDFPAGGGAWGADWVPITGSGTGPGVKTFSVGAVITLYILPASLIRKQMTLPAVGIFAADWWGLGGMTLAIDPGVVLVSAVDATTAFQVAGEADISQGFPVFPLAVSTPPAIGTVPMAHLRQGLQIGLRAGF